jgi:hypothetical protein
MSQEQKITKYKKIKYVHDMPTVYFAPINKINNEPIHLKIDPKIYKPQIDTTQIDTTQIDTTQMNMWGYTGIYPYREIDMIQMDVWGFTFDSSLKK